MFIVYLNKNFKLVSQPLMQLGTDIYCPPIQEDHIIVGCYINGKKYLIQNLLSDIEIYYNMEILTNVDFIQREHFMKAGRSFLIGVLAMIQISCGDTPVTDVNNGINDYLNANNTVNLIIKPNAVGVITKATFVTDTTLLDTNITSWQEVNGYIYVSVNADYNLTSASFRTTVLEFYDLQHCQDIRDNLSAGIIERLYLKGMTNLAGVYNGATFQLQTALRFLYIPNVLTIGQTTAYEGYGGTNYGVFRSNFLGSCNIYANTTLQTVDAGAIEGDLLYAQSLGHTLIFTPDNLTWQQLRDLP